MAKLKKNIWITFFLVSTLCTLACLSYSIKEWREISDEYESMQTSRIILLADSTSAFFTQLSTSFDLLGRYLLQVSPLTIETSFPIMDELLENNSAIKSMGVFTFDGDPVASSSNFNFNHPDRIKAAPKTLYNQSNLPVQTLLNRSHKSISDGKTEYVIPYGRFITPINHDSPPHIIVTAGVRFESMPLFYEKTHGEEEHSFEIIRWDRYLQYSIRSEFNDLENQVPDSYFQEILSVVSGDKSDRFSNIQVGKVYKNGIPYLAAVVFDPNLQLWFVSTIPSSQISKIFFQRNAVVFIAFIAFLVSFFYLSKLIDITQQKRTAALQYTLEHDVITELPNRIYLSNHLKSWLSDHESASLFYIDVDKFGDINEGFGYTIGDDILREIAERLLLCCSEGTMLAREYSNRFVILTSNIGANNEQIYAEALREMLAEPYNINEMQALLTVSVAIVNYPEHGENFNELLTSADIAMSNAKRNRNSTSTLSKDLISTYHRRIIIGNHLKTAIREDLPYMVFQPQVGRDGKVRAVEALARWSDKELGFIPPDQFIKIAEMTGQMVKLGKLIINKSIEGFIEIQSNTSTPITLSLNVSLQQLADSAFVPYFIQTLNQYNVPGNLIYLELTESIFIDDMQDIRTTCKQLSFYGIRISLDDFGTGYSSLSMLHKLQISELKIDRSFVNSITSEKKSLRLLQTILALANNYNMRTVAEGVETKEQWKALLNNNCDLFQGYYFAKPMLAKEVVTYINNTSNRAT